MKIIRVSSTWDNFAQENDGLSSCFDKIKNRSIYDFITGYETKMWFETVLKLAELKKETISRNYRCDSPNLRRNMLMNATYESSGEICIEHILLSTELRKKPVFFKSTNSPGKKAPLRCSICGKIKVDKQWVEADSHESSQFNVIYTICNGCYGKTFTAL
ncbi:MAG: hypothetical protein JXR95_15010 [Deltaproteobacteria bacterium]|nr:hypothetical protein [Deltaproteobacteria bacterium]